MNENTAATFNEIAPRLNLMEPYFLTGNITLSSGSDSGQFDMNQQGKTVFIYGVEISAIDANGKDILKDIGVAKDIVTISINDEMSTHYTNIPMPLSALVASNGSYRFPGIVLRDGVRYHVEISSAPANGTESKGSYPLNIQVTFLANKPLNKLQFQQYMSGLNNNQAQQ